MLTLFNRILTPFHTLTTAVIGRFSWQAPAWLLLLVRHKFLSIAVIVLGIVGYGAYIYKQSLPKPIMVKAELQAPALPAKDSTAPSTLTINFVYDLESLHSDQVQPSGQPTIAPIELLRKEIKQGINITPFVEGKWTWRTDSTIAFRPAQQWPPGVDYSVQFNRAIFTPETTLARTKVSFTTQPLTLNIDKLEFYQDPVNSSIRQMVSTLSSSHPIDIKSLQKLTSLKLSVNDKKSNSVKKIVNFNITHEKDQRTVYLTSETIAIPKKESYMSLEIDKDVASLLGGQGSQVLSAKKVIIPDRYSFLKMESVTSRIINNQQGNPEQVIQLRFTDAISEAQLLDALKIYRLPKSRYGQKNYRWDNFRDLGEVQDAKYFFTPRTRTTPELIANPRAQSKTFNFKIDEDGGQFLWLKINKGLTSTNGFVLKNHAQSIIRVPHYPAHIGFSGEGSLLTLSGDHKLSVSSRNVNTLKYTVGRLSAHQINHLVSQTEGNITNPHFKSYYFNKDNLVESFEETVPLSPRHPKELSYSSFDLSRYLPSEKERFGVFLVEVENVNKNPNSSYVNLKEQRLILVTDLGIIVKNNNDKSHDVFVQSLSTGLPVANARVELLGKNGRQVLLATTSDNGHISFPSTADFRDEKKPVAYVVKTNTDISFIPYDTHSRQINLSRFDIGGINIHNTNNRRNLNAYGFSDRGIYRPGETVNLAYIVKQANLDNIEYIPLELIIRGPRQNTVARKRISLPELGFFDYNYPTSPTSDTGRYTASLHIVTNGSRGATLGSTHFSVEEFQPDTMKIHSELLGVKGLAWSTHTSLQAQVTLKNLFDVAAQNRRIEGQLSVSPARFYFKKYEDYNFSPAQINPNKTLLSINETLEALTSNKSGQATFNLDLDRFKEGTYRLQLSTQGYDQAGGRSVNTRNSMLISPLKYLVGYKASGNLSYINRESKRSIDLIAINNNLQKISKDKLLLKKIAVQQVSTLVKQNNGTYKYQTIIKESEVSSARLAIGKQGYQYSINTQEVGDFALEVYDDDGHKLTRIAYSVVGTANLTASLDQNAELVIKLNKKDYKAGETIEMSIKAPYKGAGLITIETDKVQAFKWFSTQSQSAIETITIPNDLEGTGYINVTFVRDPSSKEIFTSPLSYAVEPFSIDRSIRHVTIALDVAKQVTPGEALAISFSTDKPARIALFAIDEGILQVANYQTPKPLSHFLQKQALQVSTLQILDLVLPEFSLLKQLSAAGGGSADELAALAKNLNPFSRKVDRPAVYWSGIVDATSQQNSVEFNIPDTFSGTLRVMAVAVSSSAFGATQKSTLVRGPFVITPNVLTQAAPGDEFIATVGVANIIEGAGNDARVTIAVEPSEHLSITGESTQTINIAEGDEGSVDFRVKANSTLGAAELRFTVTLATSSKQLTINGSTPLRETQSASLSVRPITTYQSHFVSGYSKKLPINFDLARTLYPELSTQYVSASSSPLVLVDGLSNYLQHYPHGCTEQIISKVFPVLGLTAYAGFKEQRARANELFTVAISKLRQRQIGSGGFSFWPGGNSVSIYPTIYAAHFLIDAKAQGYAVPNDMLEHLTAYLSDYARQQSASLNNARIRANAIYLLTRLGDVTTNYLVDLQEYLDKEHKKTWKNDLAASYMAATYQLLKNDREAGKLIKGYQLAKHNAKGYGDFHSSLTQDAQHVYLLATHFEKRLTNIGGEQLLQFIDPIFRGEYNTISASYSILALGAYSAVISDTLVDKAIRFSATSLTNDQQTLATIDGDFLQAPYDNTVKRLSIDLEGNYKSGLFYVNSQVGFDKTINNEALREGLEVHRDFLDDKGTVVTEAQQGQVLTARLRVRALGDKTLTNIAVVDLLPGGFEIIRESVSPTFNQWHADYTDIREDRIIYYGSFDNSIIDLSYQVRVTAAGKFSIPPSYAQSMYNRSIKAQSTMGNIVVKKQGH